jgi:hypothetical protein
MPRRIDRSELPSRNSHLYEHSELEIIRAVQDCARLCLRDDDPQECAHEYAAMLRASGWSDDEAQEVLLGGLFQSAPDSGPTAAAFLLSRLEGLKMRLMYDPQQTIAGPHTPIRGAKSRELPFACLSMVALTLGALSLFLPAVK